jgi:hypothetical protein
MAWPDELDAAQEIQIETRRAGRDDPRRTTIWAVVDDGEVFVRSWRGDTARWYNEILAEPDAAVIVEGDTTPVRAVPATDDDSVERASTRLREKYAGTSEVDAMVRDEILHTTLRLEPR